MTVDIADPVPDAPDAPVVAPRRTGWLGPGVIAGGVIAWSVLFSWLAIARHTHFLTHAFDMGQMTQVLWKLHHGHGDFSTVTGISILGDHARLVMYPLALLPTSIRLVLVLQAAALASGAVPVFLMTRRRAPDGWATALGVAYLAYPALQWMSLFDFHAEVLATPLLLWALWAFDGRELVYWVALGAALFCREDVAIVALVLGVVLIAERRRRQGLVTIAIGVAALAVTSTIISAHNPYGLSVFQQRYGWIGTGPIDAVKNLMFHTGTILKRAGEMHLLFSDGLMLAGYLVPLPFFILARRARVWVPLPVLIAHGLSNSPPQRSIYFQYGYLVVPLLFFAASDGIGRLAAWPKPTRRIVGVAGLVAILAVTPAFSPFIWTGYRGANAFPKPGPIWWQLPKQHPAGYIADAYAAVSLVPAGDSVSASGNLLPHVAKRDRIYMFPNPFYVVSYGRYLTQDLPPGSHPAMPRDPPAWVIVDSAHLGPDLPATRQEVLDLLPTRYTRMYQGQYISVWRLR